MERTEYIHTPYYTPTHVPPDAIRQNLPDQVLNLGLEAIALGD